MKIGIYGGSFNPVHEGHLHVAEEALNEFKLDKVYLMPSYSSPNKEGVEMAPPSDRTAMCELAAQEKKNIFVLDIEAKQCAVSYTYKTISTLKKLWPDDELYFIMGADSLDYFEQWKNPEIICRHATILVLAREQFSVSDMQKKIRQIQSQFSAKIEIIHGLKMNASSTDIKSQLLHNRSSCPKYLNHRVYEYIINHKLYLSD